MRVKTKLEWKIDPIRTLDNLKFGVAKRILSKAIRAGVKLLRDEVKATAPRFTGALRTSISTKVVAKRNRVTGIVGPRSGYAKTAKKRLVVPAWYEHFIERGTKFQSAQHPLERAMRRMKYRVLNEITRTVKEGIAELLAK